MNKTKIEWCDYTINPIKGICKHKCWYCYAKAMYKRFGWDEKIRYDPDAFYDVNKIPFGSKIFVGSTHDIFGEWVESEIIKIIISWTAIYPKHTFIFLTKNPRRYLVSVIR